MFRNFWRASAIVLGLVAGVSAFAADKAQDFTLRDINGQEVTLSQYKGQVVLVSFWATWCGPCKVEMPHLNKMYGDLKEKGLVVLSISTDDARTASQVKPFIAKNHYEFTELLDKDSTVVSTYNPTKTLPFTVIIDRDGNIVSKHSGYNPGDEVGLREEVEKLLAQGSAPAAPAP